MDESSQYCFGALDEDWTRGIRSVLRTGNLRHDVTDILRSWHSL